MKCKLKCRSLHVEYKFETANQVIIVVFVFQLAAPAAIRSFEKKKRE